MPAGFRTTRTQNGLTTDVECGCFAPLTGKDYEMRERKRREEGPVDLSAVWKLQALRLAEWHGKLYDLRCAATLSQTARGCISITVYALDDYDKFYIEKVDEAVSKFEEAMAWAMEMAPSDEEYDAWKRRRAR